MEARKKTIISILGKTGIGFLVAFAVMSQIEPDWGWDSWAMMALLFSTVPYAWGMITRCVGSWIVFDGAMLVFSIILKLFLAVLLGWIVVPISLLYHTALYAWERHKMVVEAECAEK